MHLNHSHDILTVPSVFIDSSFFRCMHMHASVFEVQDTSCWDRWFSVRWELIPQTRRHIARIQFPPSELPDGSDLWSSLNIQERTGILTLGMCGPWQAPSIQIYEVSGENSFQQEDNSEFNPLHLFFFLGPGWAREKTLPSYWMTETTAYLPRWPWAKHWGSNPFLEMLTHCFRVGSQRHVGSRVKGEG